ncbi:histidine phosphatase family protein [Lysinibacillus sp. LZ02]|uniref:histidine phosphatase family protein n=1 Tax=Lysinibacillus sp. LZ02 TaxID=3420668 RepID=UPI003D369D67
MVRTIVHLIRHELTEANIERRYIGWTDQAIRQAVQATLSFQPTMVYGSDLKRCQQTAACYFPNSSFIADERLRELHFGDFEMKTYEDLQHDTLYRAWIDEPFQVTPPNGESFDVFKARVLHAFEDIVSKQKECTFVIHGGVIKMILATYLQQGFHDVHAKHRTLYTLSWEGEKSCISLSEEPIMVNENTFTIE